jgi:hypothetical protein
MQRKLAVEMVLSMGLRGRKRACRLLGLARSSAYYQREPSAVGLALDGLVEEVSREWPCLGYKKVTFILRNEHRQVVNPKRVARVRRQRGLMASRHSNTSDLQRRYILIQSVEAHTLLLRGH